jgi:hypothetical protein
MYDEDNVETLRDKESEVAHRILMYSDTTSSTSQSGKVRI